MRTHLFISATFFVPSVLFEVNYLKLLFKLTHCYLSYIVNSYCSNDYEIYFNETTSIFFNFIPLCRDVNQYYGKQMREYDKKQLLRNFKKKIESKPGSMIEHIICEPKAKTVSSVL